MDIDPSEEALDRLLRDDGRRPWTAWWPPGRAMPRNGVAWGGTLVAVVALILGGWWWVRADAPPPEVALPVATTVAAAGPPSTTAPPAVVVHVAGAVNAPGLAHLPGGSRWADAVEAGGGLRGDADLDRVNLALPLTDGARVYVPRVGEPVPAPVAGPDPAAVGPSGVEEGATIDVNVADAAALESLPGVGEATAAAIVDHREANGPFRGPDDLLDVRGIGPAKLDALRDLVTFGP